MNIGHELFIDTEVYQIEDKTPIKSDISEQTSTLFVVPHTENDPFDATFETLIQNIAGALKLSKDQFEIIQISHPFSFSNLLKNSNLKYFILFGEASNLLEHQYQYSKNQFIQLANIKLIFTDSLTLINNPANKVQKNEFWVGLQKMYK